MYLSFCMHSSYEFCYRTYVYIHKGCRSVFVRVHPITVYRTVLGECAVPVLNATFYFFGLPIVSCSMINSLILGCLWCLGYFSNNMLAFYNLPLDLLSDYRIQHGAIGPLYVTSSNSTWIYCRGVSGFATDCPCGVWWCGLTTYLLCVGPLFRNRLLNNSWAVGLT